MKTIDRIHHICLTVSSENFEETWPKELAFFADFLGMNTYKIDVSEMDEELTLKGLEEGMGVGKQTPVIFSEDGRAICDHFYYVAGEDMSETACMIDLIVFLCKPGQMTQTQKNMYTKGLRGMQLQADNVDAIYQRGTEQGVEFLSEPVTDNWGEIGEVRYVVAKDVIGNHVELVQMADTPQGEGKILRMFSVNQNTVDLEQSLDFWRDGCGMKQIATVEHDNEAFATAVGAPGARAKTVYLQGTNPDETTTYFALTQWEHPTLDELQLEQGYTASYYRMWHWINGGKDGAQELWDKMEPKMVVPAMGPYTYPSPRPWGDVTMSFFVDYDGVHQEFANHAPGGWGGLGEMLDHPEHSKQFGVFER